MSLQDFRTAPATHIVSLGSRCAVAYNLRRFYNFQSGFPFDWWITPAAGAVKFLQRPDVEYLYDPSQLQLIGDGKTVRHKDLKIQLHHEFTREGGRVRSDWLTEIERPKNRTIALLAKFLGLNSQDNRIAFVREQTEMSEHIAERLDALFPIPECTMIAFPTIPGGHNDASGWKGDPVLWDEALSAFDLSLDLANHQPFNGR